VKLTTVGTGTAAPSPSRVCAGYILEMGETMLLLDCGSGVVHRMSELGVNWMSITHVAITHFHVDHISDLATLLLAWRYGAIPWRTRPVVLIGPPGMGDLLVRVDAMAGGSLGVLEYPIEVLELADGEAITLPGDVRLTARKVPHTPESVAYSIERSGRRIVYTGDTGRDPGLGSWAAGCDLLLTECSLPDSMRMDTHLTPEGCAELAEAAGPRALVLTHFYPPVEQVDVRAIVSQRYPGPVTLAVDGWSTEIEEM
jgi:ribonuclease BN (tRNA processing enzyme)